MTRPTAYTPATDTIDPTEPGGIERLLAFHHTTFGDARMDGSDDSDPADKAEGDAQSVFPANTPVADMTAEQQVAYWKHQSRKHEDRVKAMSDYESVKAERDDLKAKHQTADEKALEDATTAAADAARAEERSRHLSRLFAAEFRAAVGGRIPADRVATLVAPLNPTHFLTPDGEVDTDKVQQYVDGLAPVGKTWPDMGQGNRGPASKADPREAGKAAAERRFGSKS